MATLAVLVVLLLSWLLVEDPVAHVWYNARQQQRSAALSQKRAATATGQTLAVLQAPVIGLNVAVVEGDSADLLRGGPGHAKGSAFPGKVGNSVIFGHSGGWGAPFARIARLKPGDLLYLRLHGTTQALAFAVTSVKKTSDDAPLLRSTTDHRLTLVTGGGGRRPGAYMVVTAVSGTEGKVLPRSTPVSNPGSGPVVFSRDVGLFLLRGAAAALVVVLLRRRYRPGVVVALATPLVLAALLALMLDLDRVLSPLG
jgi:LPXTG-site transpeptidase (sortase) family protein